MAKSIRDEIGKMHKKPGKLNSILNPESSSAAEAIPAVEEVLVEEEPVNAAIKDRASASGSESADPPSGVNDTQEIEDARKLPNEKALEVSVLSEGSAGDEEVLAEGDTSEEADLSEPDDTDNGEDTRNLSDQTKDAGKKKKSSSRGSGKKGESEESEEDSEQKPRKRPGRGRPLSRKDGSTVDRRVTFSISLSVQKALRVYCSLKDISLSDYVEDLLVKNIPKEFLEMARNQDN